MSTKGYDGDLQKSAPGQKISSTAAAKLRVERDARQYCIKMIERDSEGQHYLATMTVPGARLQELLSLILRSDLAMIWSGTREGSQLEVIDIRSRPCKDLATAGTDWSNTN